MSMRLKNFCLFGALALLCRPAVAHEDSWVEVKSPHFTVASNADEKEARRIANQFEEIRAVFQMDFPGSHVDMAKPLLIIAVKNEDSLKVLLPDYWSEKGRMHPSGEFVEGPDESFSVLRTDVSGGSENPYYDVYEQYAFAIEHLNFSSLPFWLRFGMAEFYANTIVEDTETQVGPPRRAQLALLQSNRPIPLEQVLSANQSSPIFNDRNLSPIFYAESWAIFHYLMLDPDASKLQYLSKYLKAWSETSDGVEAARQTFGDMAKFEVKIDNYARQPAFYFSRRPPAAKFSEKDYKARAMSQAEALAIQADFLQHTNHPSQAQEMLKEALVSQPDLGAIHACLGYADYLQVNDGDAEKEFNQAASLNPQDSRSFFFLALIAARKAGYTSQSTPQIVSYLEKVVQLNPNFATGYAYLSIAERQQPETRAKALDAALKAYSLQPAVLGYLELIGDASIALDRDADARAILDKLNKSATTPQDRSSVQAYANRLAKYEASSSQNTK